MCQGGAGRARDGLRGAAARLDQRGVTRAAPCFKADDRRLVRIGLVELAGLRDWDRRTLFGFADTRPLAPPTALVAPSLVILAERSLLITAPVAAELLPRTTSVPAFTAVTPV